MAQTSLDVAKSLYAAFRRKDHEFVLSLFSHEAIVHGPTMSQMILPWGGSYQGIEDVKQFFKLLGAGLDIEQLDIIDFISEREKVTVLGYIKGKSKTANKSFETYFAHILKIDLSREQIIEFRVFNDSASLMISMKS